MRNVICPVCGAKTQTSMQKTWEEEIEVIQSHWDGDGPCAGSLTPATTNLPSWTSPSVGPPVSVETRLQELTDVVDQLILDQLMGGM